MPFTLSHPAIILPLYKKLSKYFDLTGLVLGSMAPDFEYFIKFYPSSTIGHTFLGFLCLNLPLCFLIAYIFHFLIKQSLILNLISPLDKWFYNYVISKWSLKSFKDVIVFIYSSFIGMASHVLWDSFTHSHGFFVDKFPILNMSIKIYKFNIPIYKFLQHGSTILGFLVLILFLYKSKNNSKIKPYSNKRKYIYFSRTILITIIIFTCNFLILGNFSFKFLGNYVVTLINGVLIGIFISSILDRKKYKGK